MTNRDKVVLKDFFAFRGSHFTTRKMRNIIGVFFELKLFFPSKTNQIHINT